MLARTALFACRLFASSALLFVWPALLFASWAHLFVWPAVAADPSVEAGVEASVSAEGTSRPGESDSEGVPPAGEPTPSEPAPTAGGGATTPGPGDDSTYEREEIMDAAVRLFGEASAGLGSVIERAFADHGKPTGYVAGEEAAAAFIVGLRYGSGELTLKSGVSRVVYWKGPSVGLDWGGNVSKTFILLYGLEDEARLYQRFPGVDGSLYFVAGFGLNYNQSGSIILAPIRTGVGLRAGANVGYVHLTEERSWVPF